MYIPADGAELVNTKDLGANEIPPLIMLDRRAFQLHGILKRALNK